MDSERLITIDPEIMGGIPCFVGTRVPLDVLFENLSDSLTVDEIGDSYLTLSKKLVLKVLANPDQIRRARSARPASAIAHLDRPGLTKDAADVQNRLIAGEITTHQAIQMMIEKIRARQRVR